AVVQGSSAIQTKATHIKAIETCNEREGWTIPNVIHDAIFWEDTEDFIEEDAKVIEDVMVITYPWCERVDNGTYQEVMIRMGERRLNLNIGLKIKLDFLLYM